MHHHIVCVQMLHIATTGATGTSGATPPRGWNNYCAHLGLANESVQLEQATHQARQVSASCVMRTGLGWAHCELQPRMHVHLLVNLLSTFALCSQPLIRHQLPLLRASALRASGSSRQLLPSGYDTFVLDGGWSQGRNANGNQTQVRGGTSEFLLLHRPLASSWPALRAVPGQHRPTVSRNSESLTSVGKL
jgi:hypothetical protein